MTDPLEVGKAIHERLEKEIMNPLNQCDSRLDGVRCEGAGAFVYRTAFHTRIVCDECAHRYRTEDKYSSGNSPVEFFLGELEPARTVLVETLRKHEAAIDKWADSEGRRIRRENWAKQIWGVNALAGIAAMVGFAWLHFIVGFLLSVTAFVSIAWGVARRAEMRRLADIAATDKEHGHPELGL